MSSGRRFLSTYVRFVNRTPYPAALLGATVGTMLTVKETKKDQRGTCDGSKVFPFNPGSVTYCREANINSGSDQTKNKNNGVITQNEDYIKGIKIYGIGILEDPVPGEKRGRGVQHLTSSYWIYDMGVFINREFRVLQTMLRYAHERSQIYPGYDYRYFTNISNALFLKAEAEGLATADGRDFFLMAAWCAMAAAEVDGFQYAKYSPQQRARQREAFYHKYLNPRVLWVEEEADDPAVEAQLGKYAIEGCRIDLLPSVALERLGIHNELCALKWEKPSTWLREGFPISSRIDSMKRHYESIHARDSSEDHIAHLIWGFMAVTHVVACFPHMNDLANFESVRRQNVLKMDEHIQALVGDGGFRAAKSGQSAHRIVKPTSASRSEKPSTASVDRRPSAGNRMAQSNKGGTSAVAQEAKDLHQKYTGEELKGKKTKSGTEVKQVA